MWRLCHSKVRWWAMAMPIPTIPTLPAIPPTHLVLPHLMPMEVVEQRCPSRPSRWQRHGHSWRWCSCHVVMPHCRQKFDLVSSRRQQRRKLFHNGEGNFGLFCVGDSHHTISHTNSKSCDCIFWGRQRKRIIWGIQKEWMQLLAALNHDS